MSLENSRRITQLTKQLFDFFVEQINEPNHNDAVQRFQRCGELVRFHDENLSKTGDLSIAANRINWQCFCQKRGLKLRQEQGEPQQYMLPTKEAEQQLLEQSQKWLFPLLNINELPKERYALRFQRAPIINNVLRAIMEQGSDYGKHVSKSKESGATLCLSLEMEGAEELRYYRQRQLYLIFRRLLDYSHWRLIEQKEANAETLHVYVQAQRPPAKREQQSKHQTYLICGPVLEPITKTSTVLTSASYKALRSNDMVLMAIHRNGVRDCPKGNDFQSLMQRLGTAAVTVDLFEVRHSSAASVVRNGLGCSKGAAYVLYNSARLETLLRTFNAQVEAGVYEPLPPLAEIDLTLLEDELDWQLIFGYLLTFPEVVESTMDQLPQGHCAVHMLVQYIVGLASLFSRYYRNKQILVQKRVHLMPTLYARVYLIKAVREVLNSALALLGIEPVDYM